MMAIRGKILNAMRHSQEKAMANAEIMGIMKAMGFSIKNPDDMSKLRYPGGIVWATDQDGDGRHIAALGTVTLCTFFPALMNIPGFFKYLNTPLLRCKPLTRSRDVIALG
jgi:DNA gyrase/topoisomerase IV subunit B